MKGFSDAGGYVTTAFWEYAPSGRAHVYPPFLHAGMLFLYKLGLEPMTIARSVECISYPALLWVFRQMCLRFYSPRASFFAVLLLASFYPFYLASTTLAAFNLAFIFALLAFKRLKEGGWLGAALCLTLCFYTHAGMAFLASFALAVYAILERDARAVIFTRVLPMAGLLAAPLLIHQFSNRAYFAFVQVKENRRIEIDVCIALLALAGLFTALKTKNAAARFAIAWLIGFSPLLWTHPLRFFSGHGVAGMVLLAALALDLVSDRLSSRRSALAAIFVAAFFLLAAPIVEWNPLKGTLNGVWGDRTLTRILSAGQGMRPYAQASCVYFPESYSKILKLIERHSGKADILWSDFAYGGGLLAVLSGRVASSAMLAEVKPYESRDPLADARLLIWFKDKNARAPAGMDKAVRERGLKQVGETDMAYVFENPAGYASRKIPKALIPTWALFAIPCFFFTIAKVNAIIYKGC